MSRIALRERSRDTSLAYLRATLPPQAREVCIRYKTRLGALLRVDGAVVGAFDREHHEVVLPPCDRERSLELEVELHALPTSGLPSGPNVIWWYLNATARQEPARFVDVSGASAALGRGSTPQHDTPAHHDKARDGEALKAFGHSHLDVAWLWTYEETRRKAQRTFAIACDLLDRDDGFRFIQSQPQLYAFVEESDDGLFDRVRAHVAGGRFDPRVAALWVESDCNLPSGESLLRQMLYAHVYCKERFAVTPTVAWLPDSFGFMNTLPQLLAHAGIEFFGTTKLQWNDTTKFPYPQFVWKGPDGSAVVGAMLQGYDGPAYPWRVKTAHARNEPLALGYGDGGGGVTSGMLDYVRKSAEWIDLVRWFEELREGKASLPVHQDELYLQYHRGVYTTHRDVKMHNALCERALDEVEELLAWCLAVHAPRSMVRELAARVDDVWRTVLRNQFHDVLPGTSIAPVYDDVRAEYAQAEEVLANTIAATHAMLPRATSKPRGQTAVPREDGDDVVFENGLIAARVRRNGTIVELRSNGGPNVCTQANALALYRDTPKAWEAWNIDRGYERKMKAAQPQRSRIEDGGLIVDLLLGSSPASMRIELMSGEPFLRVTLSVDWRERRTLLRSENWLALRADAVTYGAPHGSITRSANAQTPEEQAKFEVPGQRYAMAVDGAGNGIAMLATDTYGWSARALAGGGIKLGHSVLRGTCWPDPHADEGEHIISYAYAPIDGSSIGNVERLWRSFAHEPRVRLFTCDAKNVVVAACKPAHDGDGVIVRVRECDGVDTNVRLRCGARMTWAQSVDALERATFGSVGVENEYLIFNLPPFGLRSMRVRFSHA